MFTEHLEVLRGNTLRIISLYLAKDEHVVFMLVSAESCLENERNMFLKRVKSYCTIIKLANLGLSF